MTNNVEIHISKLVDQFLEDMEEGSPVRKLHSKENVIFNYFVSIFEAGKEIGRQYVDE